MSAKTTTKAQDAMPGATGGTDQVDQATRPRVPEPEYPSVPFSDVFAWRDEYDAAIVSQSALARIMTAMDSIGTLSAILQQREVDAEDDGPVRLTFGAPVAVGIATAIGCCAELVKTIIEKDDFEVVKAEPCTLDAERMDELRRSVRTRQRARG